MRTENESSISDILDLTDRIKEIHIAILYPVHRLGEKLFGPFPALEGLRIENSYGWPLLGDQVPSYPNLRWLSLVQSHPTFSIPIHSTRLNFVEIVYDSFWYPWGWADLSDALQSLPELQVLKLGNFPDPDTVPGRRISLPSVRRLTLQGPTARCIHFISALESPQISEFRLELWDVIDCVAMLGSVTDTLSTSPRTMGINRLPDHRYNAPAMTEIEVDQSMEILLSYQDALQSAAFQWNIQFVWNCRVSDPELLGIVDAVSEIRLLNMLESLLIYKCNVVPQGSWLNLLRRLDCVQTLTVGSCPASGMFWDLLKHEEDPHKNPPLLPMLRTIALISVDCSLGGWMPRGNGAPGNSYCDLDSARFFELLVCYLEMRITKLPELKLLACIGFSVAEIKLLRRLVDEVQWDGCGSIGASYPSHADPYFGLTINHQLLNSRPGYAEFDLTSDSEWLKLWPRFFDALDPRAGRW
ncbi:hypothetical protein B0H10DRAFT_1990299 [Mycena sp. CBHHK59/15]|nr:hypothetical protein B0H10DRAFT_1990299 [Mycena sp. CBHHK59/15]